MGNIISVIMPAYNAEKTCEAAIRSVLDQEFIDLELIVIDDGSIDNTLNICLDLQKQEKRLKVIHQENKGVSAARNAGLGEATGQYICFVDSDDITDTKMFEKLYEVTKKDNLDFVICGFSVVENGKAVSNWVPDKCENIVDLCEKLLRSDMGLNSLWTKMFKREKIKIQFNNQKNMGEDLEFISEFLMNAETCAVVQESLYRYTCDTDKSLTSRIDKILLAIPEDMYERLKIIENKGLSPQLVYDKFYAQIEGILSKSDTIKNLKNAIGILNSNEEYRKMIHIYMPEQVKNKMVRVLLQKRAYNILFIYLRLKRMALFLKKCDRRNYRA
jgi:glycosyltransferase involved in cell wall biosynthesis